MGSPVPVAHPCCMLEAERAVGGDENLLDPLSLKRTPGVGHPALAFARTAVMAAVEDTDTAEAVEDMWHTRSDMGSCLSKRQAGAVLDRTEAVEGCHYHSSVAVVGRTPSEVVAENRDLAVDAVDTVHCAVEIERDTEGAGSKVSNVDGAVECASDLVALPTHVEGGRDRERRDRMQAVDVASECNRVSSLGHE